MVISFKSPSKVEACLSRLKKRDTLKDIDCSLTDKIAKNDKYAPITSTYATLSIFRAHRMNVIANAQETVNFPITQATLAGIHREDRGRGLGQAEWDIQCWWSLWTQPTIKVAIFAVYMQDLRYIPQFLHISRKKDYQNIPMPSMKQYFRKVRKPTSVLINLVSVYILGGWCCKKRRNFKEFDANMHYFGTKFAYNFCIHYINPTHVLTHFGAAWLRKFATAHHHYWLWMGWRKQINSICR